MKNKLLKSLLVLNFVILLTSPASAMTCTNLTKSLSKGQENSEVLKLQQFLVDGGYLTVKPNGYFGAVTVTAIKKFQLANGMSPVGSVGPLTRSKLKEVSCGFSSKINNTSKNIKSEQAGATPSKDPLAQPRKQVELLRAMVNSDIKLNVFLLDTEARIIKECSGEIIGKNCDLMKTSLEKIKSQCLSLLEGEEKTQCVTNVLF